MFFEIYAKEIVSAVVPILLWLLTRLTQSKVKLRYASPHDFTFLVDEPVHDKDNKVVSQKQTVHTITHLVMNVGTKTATNVEVVFNVKPRYINLWPIRHFEPHLEQDDRYVMVFSSMAPREQISLHVFTLQGQSPGLLNVRSDQAIGEKIGMRMYPFVARWRVILIQALALLGLGASVYLLLELLQFIVLKTPAGH